MVTQELLDSGVSGGEGGQRMTALAASSDGALMLAGTDVGGMWRSTNSGKSWETVFGGFYPKGCFSIAVDPKNSSRVLAYGASPTRSASVKQGNMTNGLYLSEDGGVTWRFVLQQKGACLNFDFRESIAFDPASYDESAGKCMVAYWSRPWDLQDMPLSSAPYYNADAEVKTFAEDIYDNKLVSYTADRKCLWKTTDGGETWEPACDGMTDGIVKVHPTDGVVYVSNLSGFHRSTDGGQTFDNVLGGRMIYGLDVISTKPDYVYVNDTQGIWISRNKGESFTMVTNKNSGGFPESYDDTTPDGIVRSLKVSPVNPQNMVMASHRKYSRYASLKYYSHDGGATWWVGNYNEDKDFFKVNNRDTCFLWSPTDGNKLWAFGGDWIVSSDDGGYTYSWDYNGGAAVFMDGRAAFNVTNPDIFYYGAQDFHGALTTDGGSTWKHIWKWADLENFTGAQESYGSVYGAYAASDSVLAAIASTGSWSAERRIVMSYDGGETWTDTGVKITKNKGCKWAEMCYQSPTDANVLFAGNYRSADNGKTWSEMTDINTVYCHNPYGQKELYASDDSGYIVVSYDDGATWSRKIKAKTPADTTIPTIWDIAYDGINDIIYYVSGTSDTGVYFCKVQDGLTEDLTSHIIKTDMGSGFQLCAVDPRYPQVVYIGGYGGAYVAENGVQRSVDGGRSFNVLSSNGKESSIVKGGPAGGMQVYEMLVHPATGELWVSNGCRGWSRIAPPYAE